MKKFLFNLIPTRFSLCLLLTVTGRNSEQLISAHHLHVTCRHVTPKTGSVRDQRVLAYLVISGTWIIPHIGLSLLTPFEPLVMASWKIFLNIPYLLSPDPHGFSPCQTPKPSDGAHKWEKEKRVCKTIVLSLLWGGWLAVSFRGKSSSSELLLSSWRHKSTGAGWTPVRCVRQRYTCASVFARTQWAWELLPPCWDFPTVSWPPKGIWNTFP